jgi:hypothetical protein
MQIENEHLRAVGLLKNFVVLERPDAQRAE